MKYDTLQECVILVSYDVTLKKDATRRLLIALSQINRGYL